MVAQLKQSVFTSPTGPASDVVPLDALKSDSAPLPRAVSGIRCKGVAGNVVVVTGSGETRTYPIGLDETLPCVVKQVRATGTTATGLWGFVV